METFQCRVKGSLRLLTDRKPNKRNTIANFYSIAQLTFFPRNAKPYNLKCDSREERFTLKVYVILIV